MAKDTYIYSKADDEPGSYKQLQSESDMKDETPPKPLATASKTLTISRSSGHGVSAPGRCAHMSARFHHKDACGPHMHING